MSNGPTALFDKSTVQMLSVEEARWFFHFFRGVVTPVFMAEVLGNLTKKFGDGRDPKRMVASLAKKTDALGTLPNVSHIDLITQSLMGIHVEMTYRPLVGNAQRVVTEQGEQGWFIDQTPEERVLQKWRAGEFEEAEFVRAEAWRTAAYSVSYDTIIDACSEVPADISRTVARLTLADFRNSAIQTNADASQSWKIYKRALDTFGIVGSLRKEAILRWDRAGRPSIDRYSPYAYFLLCVISTTMMGIGRRLVSSRPTNIIDEQYLYYVPFAQIFVSNDQMHRQIAPLFMSEEQLFLWGTDVKSALRDFVKYYNEHKADLARLGSMSFARYPPLGLNTVILEVYDRLVPNWRQEAKKGPPPPISKEESDRIMEHLRPVREAIDKLRGADPRPQ